MKPPSNAIVSYGDPKADDTTAVETSQTPAELANALAALKLNTEEILKHKRRLEQLNGWFEIALDNMARGLSMFDAEQRLIVCNKLYKKIYHLPDELVRPGTPLADILRFHVKRETGRDHPSDLEKQRKWIARHVAELAHGKTFSYVQELKDGRTILVSNQPLTNGGWVDLQEDITDKRRAEQKITWLARHDPLTEIANRFHFREELERALKDVPAGEGFAIHWIDLDKFKEVNDTYGHPVGDALLKSVAHSLSRAIRRPDLVGRLGGDEFAILQRHIKHQSDAETLAGRLLRAISGPHHVAGHMLNADACIGIACVPAHGHDLEEILKNVDVALYKAKARGGRCYAFFEPGEDESVKERHRLEVDLKHALERNELILNYQPIVNLKANAVTSFEALMRWHHPRLGLISPNDFIPIAEHTGLIVPIGEWALERACMDAAKWPERIRVTVNLSSVQFDCSDLVAAVQSALKKSGLAPERLELEITERLLLRDCPGTQETLGKLQQIGVRIALDDFGTGFASLGYLQNFPFDKIKIDRNFVRDVPVRADCVAIVRALANLGKNLNIDTVAEGIETHAHYASITGLGCDEVQGFYFSQPVSSEDVDEALASCRLKCLVRAPQQRPRRPPLRRIRRTRFSR